ncbi:MAG TPA: response regulator transcription factor [Gemmataceae bacterium]|nr:response regulator transcription factor [Gemmataceae bacterium]
MSKIRVLLVDDHAVLRAGLRMLLNAQPDIEVVGEAADTREALTLACATRPDVMTLDLTMPGGGSIPLIERLRQDCPQTRVIVLTMHDDPAYLRAVLAAGGRGYIVKTAADSDLLTAIRAAFQERIFVDLQLGEKNTPAKTESYTHGAKSLASNLSQREREVLTYLAQGHTNQEIADQLFLSVKTIETYRARLTDKLGLRTRAELVRYAQGIGLSGLKNDVGLQTVE